MKSNRLLLLALRQMRERVGESHNDYRFLIPELGLLRSIHGIADVVRFLSVEGQPYRLTEGRVVYFRAGTLRLRINLRELEFKAGDFLVVSPGTVFEFLYISSDLDLAMLAFSNSLMESWQKEELLQVYLQGRLFLHLSLTEQESRRMEQIFALLWEVVHDRPFPKESVQSLISLVFHQTDGFRGRELEAGKQKRSRQEEVFNRFLELVNKYAVHERSCTFYADRLCLTSRYLSTLVRQASGRTVMDWVNEAVIQEAKLMLCHTDKLVYQIADELNFPNASFFCKYFRRMTGMTPKDYREENG
ncbi:AraC family transcriptional regulator [Bacteroides mediterraneensis]|uniref:AraC family transcriptional regulator n=1 Tax=Bacteroides mediterraneensis TaxID=1841856 RepID=UPI0026EBCBE9|nr:AraC family transcriptional regulator [Bacteroides mediterraneensis]